MSQKINGIYVREKADAEAAHASLKAAAAGAWDTSAQPGFAERAKQIGEIARTQLAESETTSAPANQTLPQ